MSELYLPMLDGIGFNPPSGLGGAYIEIGLNAMPLPGCIGRIGRPAAQHQEWIQSTDSPCLLDPLGEWKTLRRASHPLQGFEVWNLVALLRLTDSWKKKRTPWGFEWGALERCRIHYWISIWFTNFLVLLLGFERWPFNTIDLRGR